MSRRLLVVAGEASGDRAAAAVVSVLRREHAVIVVGMGGPALEAAGMSLLADLRDTTAMGLGAVALRARAILTSGARILHACAREPFDAALLVNYSDFNAQLAPILHRRGIHVVWYGAPQVWAWRSGRADALRPHVDRMAVMLPFEAPLWRARGIDAHYVGHPARETQLLSRAEARHTLALTELASTIAILPGSRPHEVEALLPTMLDAADRVRRDRASIDTRVLLASSLDRVTRTWARERAAAYGVETVDVSASRGAGAILPAFDVALTASGTASLEAALARAIPVVAYRVGLVTEAIARLLVRTPYYALPNVLLQRRAFPELVQRDVNGGSLARSVARTLDARPELLSACDEVERVLGDKKAPAEEVAAMLLPWLRPRS